MFKFQTSFPVSFENTPSITRQEPHETLRLCFLVNGEKYWLPTNESIEVDKQYQIVFTSKENNYRLYVGEETQNINVAANIYTNVPESIFSSNFQLGHYLHNNQAQGIYDELYKKKTQITQSTIDLWHASTTEKVDLNASVDIDVAKNPIIAGAGGVVIDNSGVFGYNNGAKRAGFGTDGKFVCGSGAIKGDENGLSIANGTIKADSSGLTTYSNGVPQITIGANGKLTFANGAVVADSNGLHTYSNGVLQCDIGTDGKLIAGAGGVVLDNNGITISNGKLTISNNGTVTLDGSKKVLNVWSTGLTGYIEQDKYALITWTSLGYRPIFLVYGFGSSQGNGTEMWPFMSFNSETTYGIWPFLIDNNTLHVYNFYNNPTVRVRYYIFSLEGI